MTPRPRIIPVLLVRRGGLVKSFGFKKHIYIGDPINAVRIFNELQADEVILIDIDASKESRSIDPVLVKEIGEEAMMPLTIGGGIRNAASALQLIRCGAERVLLGTNAIRSPETIRQISDAVGSSSVSICLDYKISKFRSPSLYSHSGLHKLNTDLWHAAKIAEEYGAGEIILQSIERDGSMQGFDFETISRINAMVTIPVIGLGGAGTFDDFESLYRHTQLSGMAAGSFFVFQGKHKGVLISYPSVKSFNFSEDASSRKIPNL